MGCAYCGGFYFPNYDTQKYCCYSCSNRARRKKDGYVKLKIDGKRVKQHVFVMEEHLGRKLYASETIHHKNGIKSDNSLDNLELWDSSHPPGQRVEDKIKWCEEFLAKHGRSTGC